MKKIVVKLSVVLTLLCATTFGSCQTNPKVVDVQPFNYAWVDNDQPYQEEGDKEYQLEYYEGLAFVDEYQPVMDTSYTLMVDEEVAQEFSKIIDKYYRDLMAVTDEYFDAIQDKYKYILDTTFIVVKYNNGVTKLELNK